jgi:hypothetical protein
MSKIDIELFASEMDETMQTFKEDLVKGLRQLKEDSKVEVDKEYGFRIRELQRIASDISSQSLTYLPERTREKVKHLLSRIQQFEK